MHKNIFDLGPGDLTIPFEQFPSSFWSFRFPSVYSDLLRRKTLSGDEYSIRVKRSMSMSSVGCKFYSMVSLNTILCGLNRYLCSSIIGRMQ